MMPEDHLRKGDPGELEAVLLQAYIGHPLYGNGTPGWEDPEKNIERYLRWVALFTNMGVAVACWHHHYMLHEDGLTGPAVLFRDLDPQGIDQAAFYLALDKAMILRSDVFVQAGPMVASSGLRCERCWSEQANLGIITAPFLEDPEYMPPVHPDDLPEQALTGLLVALAHASRAREQRLGIIVDQLARMNG